MSAPDIAPPTYGLRDYQQECRQRVHAAHDEGVQRPAVVMATGLGKTRTFTAVGLDHVTGAVRGGVPGRVLALAHRGELVDQIAATFATVSGDRDIVGVVQAERNEPGRPVVVGTVQTLRNLDRLDAVLSAPAGPPTLVIVDEAHHVVSPSHMSVIGRAGCLDPQGTPLLGVSATLSRGDDKILGDVLDAVVFERNIQWAVDRGHLVRPHGKTVKLEGLDLTSCKVRGGDYRDEDLGEVIGASAEAIADVWAEHAASRRTMVFVPTVDSAHEVCAALVAAGAAAAVVVGTTPRDERDRIYAAFRAGELNVMVSVAVLTEGFDEPSVDCVLMARPTRLAHVYVQAVGRGLRTAPGKTDCLVLDVVGVAREHELCTIAELGLDPKHSNRGEGESGDTEPGEEGGEAEPPVLRHDIDLEDIELFSSSPVRWLHTRAGIRFVSAGEESVFVWPVDEDEELYRPGVIRHRPPYGAARPLTDGPVSLADAKLAAEVYSVEAGQGLANRTASWRRRRSAPSEAQVRFARQLGITDPHTYTKPALSDMISIAVASRVLDRYAS